MHPLQLSAIAALIGLALFLYIYTTRGGQRMANAWMFPAALSLAFAIFSLVTIARDGIVPVWVNHTTNLWGNQVWFDLLIGFGISWVFLATQGRRLGMSQIPWIIALFATGNVGLLAMLARVLYLRDRQGIAAG